MKSLARLCPIALLVCVACAARPEGARDFLLGSWRGSATFRGADLDLSMRFFGEGDSLQGTVSSSDLMLLEQPLDSARYQGGHVRFATRDEHPLRFEGRLEGDTIRGTAPIAGVPGVVEAGGDRVQPVRFLLHRAKAPPLPPYATREVRFANGGVTLAGTLFVPSGGPSRHPGMVILQGSSSNLRKEYLFYADHFARAGLVVLTFDKRGKGESTGDYGAASYHDLVGDAATAVEFLRRQPEVDPARTGIWGLSQGAFIAPLVAMRVPSIAFVVAVSPPGTTIGENAAYQDSVRLIGRGFSTVEAAQAARLNRRILTWLGTGAREESLAADLSRHAHARWRRASSLPVELPARSSLPGWYWSGRTLDPLPSWRALRVPVLVVFGAEDELLSAAISAPRIERALREGGNQDFVVRVFPAANHVLRRLPLVAGGAWDWPRAAPGYLELITDWVQRHGAAGGR